MSAAPPSLSLLARIALRRLDDALEELAKVSGEEREEGFRQLWAILDAAGASAPVGVLER